MALNRLAFSTSEQIALLIPAAAQGDHGRLQVFEAQDASGWLQIWAIEATSLESFGPTDFLLQTVPSCHKVKD